MTISESGQPRLAHCLLDAGPVEGADHRFADDDAAEQHSLDLRNAAPDQLAGNGTFAGLQIGDLRSELAVPIGKIAGSKLWNAEIKEIALGLGLVGSTTSRLGRIQGQVISLDTIVNSTDNSYITRYDMPVNPDRMTRKLVSIPNELLRAIDDFRFQRRIRTESEAIRQLIERGLGKAAKPSRRTDKKPRSTGKSAGRAR